ncbi:cyclic AMP-dependent transcription factor ATF-7-like isoform X2 [Lineus longissimus]|uniref:cyclic AMP-dependent transcription factor ATF-7-like isoform X2 n=1 Tax=Lineus longissimus TaxID=88925 RepID=UPI00315C7E57
MSPDDDKPFACNAPGCGMRFTNEDHLTVHKRKHEMSLALNSSSSAKSVAAHSSLFVDQTPTPTKFLRNCDEIGLFHELSKNPFEEAFKKASDGLSTGLPPIPGPTLDTPQALDTPTSALLHSISKVISMPGQTLALDTPTHVLDTPTPVLLRPLSRVESHDIPELSADNIITIPFTEATTPVPPVEVVSTMTTTTANEAVRIKQEPNEMSQSSPVTTSQPVETTPSPQQEIELFASGVAPDPTMQPVVTSHVTSATQGAATTGIPVPNPMATLSPQILKGGQVATVQMFIQLPNGQTIPVSIPAAIAPQTSQVVPNSSAPESLVTVTTATSSSALTKQKLKAALSQNNPQNIMNSNMMVMTEAVERVTSMEQNYMDSMSVSSPETPPTTIPTIVASAIPRIDVVSPAESDYSFCDPDSSTVPSKRSRLEEGDPDERRRKFLERNRAAAARCRYKRKAWINGLEKKSDDLAGVNQRLTSEITSLRTEIAQLKSLLLAHKNCPVTLQQQAQQGQLNLVSTPEEMDAASSPASAGITVVNTVSTATTALKQIQNKAVPISTFLSQNNIPIASASTAVPLATVAPATVAGGVNQTYIIVTNQPTNGQS